MPGSLPDIFCKLQTLLGCLPDSFCKLRTLPGRLPDGFCKLQTLPGHLPDGFCKLQTLPGTFCSVANVTELVGDTPGERLKSFSAAREAPGGCVQTFSAKVAA